MIKRALISVSDKRGLVDFARILHKRGIEIISTGGSAQTLENHGIPVCKVSDHTQFPEILDGRVKTLHPKIHGGILAQRELPEHQKALKKHQIETIDLVVVNLYPFRETIAKPLCRLDDAIEQIDIGGPAMIRAAAKNYTHVAVVTNPDDYPMISAELQEYGSAISKKTRFELAKKAFAHTAAYDGAISNYLSSLNEQLEPTLFPDVLTQQWIKCMGMRYGENPHQKAAFYRDVEPVMGSIVMLQQLQGKELSYNNLVDADAAWECVKNFAEPCCVIVKHANPCGVATGRDLTQAYRRAFSTDATSAFGGIIAFNQPLDEEVATQVVQQFVEVVISPGISDETLKIFAKKPNVRLLSIPLHRQTHAAEYKKINGGLLVQSPDLATLDEATLQYVTQKKPSAAQLKDLLFAWKVAKHVRSNAVVFCKGGMTIGIGAGQMSRVDSTRIAVLKAQKAGLPLTGSAVASDAFFPFRDGVDVLVQAGASHIIQPGGSVRDDEVIEAANEHGISMIFTGIRHFKH